MDKVWGVCRHCGWILTMKGVRENGGVPYCCGSAERDWL